MNSLLFDTIEIHNFLSIGDASLDLGNQGFVVVNGYYEGSSDSQSNGSGKSSIFDAIFWTLTGSTLRGTSNVVNRYSSTGCLCKLDFHDNENNYSIIRTKSHKELGNTCQFFINDEMITNQIKQSQEMISQTLPVISPEVLGSVILLGQGLPYKFSSFSPSKRKELLEIMSGSSNKLDKIKSKLDIEESSHTTSKFNYQNIISRTEGELQGVNRSIASLLSKLASDNEESISSEIKSYSEKVSNLSKELNEVNTQIKEQENHLTEIRRNIDVLTNTSLSEYQSMKAVISSKLSSIKSGNCPTCGRPYEINDETLKLKDILTNKLSQVNTILDNINAKLNSYRIQETSYQQSYSNLINTRISLSQSINSYNSKIKIIESTKDQLDSLKVELHEAELHKDSLLIQINENTKLVESEDNILYHLSFLKRLLSKEFKGYLLKDAIEYLSDKAKYYSKFLFKDNSIVNIELSGTKIIISADDKEYENLSGGERQKVDLIVQFAMRDMLMTSLGFSSNLLVLDEVFDNLDSQGSSSLIEMITSELSDIESVYIITHHSEIDIPYDSTISVIKNPQGVSRIEWR